MEKTTILLVDDTPANLKTLSTMLKEEYRIIVAKSGERALALIEEGTLPDLVLLDIMMPGMSGYDVCSRLKENRETGDIPVIFITAKDGPEDRKKGLALGAAAFVTKPFDALTVRQIVKTHLCVKKG